MRIFILALLIYSSACGPANRGGNGTPDAPGTGADGSGGGDATNDGCGGLPNCYSVYAHSDDTLYVIDLMTKQLQTVGPFNAPAVGGGSGSGKDVITDLAVAPDGTIWSDHSPRAARAPWR